MAPKPIPMSSSMSVPTLPANGPKWVQPSRLATTVPVGGSVKTGLHADEGHTIPALVGNEDDLAELHARRQCDRHVVEIPSSGVPQQAVCPLPKREHRRVHAIPRQVPLRYLIPEGIRQRTRTH